MRCWCISEAPLTLGAEAWSGPIPLIYSALFFASFVLVSSRLQGGKFLAREWRWLVWCPSTCRNEVGEIVQFLRKEQTDEQWAWDMWKMRDQRDSPSPGIPCGTLAWAQDLAPAACCEGWATAFWPNKRRLSRTRRCERSTKTKNDVGWVCRRLGFGLGLAYLWSWWGSRAGRCRSRWSRRLLRFRLRCW